MSASHEYHTRQRALILDYLVRRRAGHVTADEIARHLAAGQGPIGKATIYRYLDKLVSQGRVRKFFLEEGTSACYQYVDETEGCHEHFHLKCVDCGALIHLHCELLGQIREHIQQEHGFAVDSSRTVFYGRCATCAEKHAGAPS